MSLISMFAILGCDDPCARSSDDVPSQYRDEWARACENEGSSGEASTESTSGSEPDGEESESNGEESSPASEDGNEQPIPAFEAPIYEEDGGLSTVSESAGSDCTVFRPADLTGNHAVILWGNGTGASPNSYRGLLDHWASWGFVVVAADTSNAGTGEEMLACLDVLERAEFADEIDFGAVGTSGHSQGGGGAIMAGIDPRIATTAPIEGYTLGLGHDRSSHTRQSGPMLILSGGNDTLVDPDSNHARLFERTNVPAVWAILEGASHFEPVGDGGGFRGITTAWFLYRLQNDPVAAQGFEGRDCGFCNDPDFAFQQRES